MKNLAKIFMMVAALFAFACTTDVTEDLGVQIGDGAGQTTLTVSLEESRTQLGEKVGDLYPLYWSEGDAIAVNGQVSNALTAEQAGSAGAIFIIEPAATLPYSITYPANAAVAIEEEVEGETTPAVPSVVFLPEQTYTEGTFCAGAAPMYAYATEEGPIQMQHLTGVLRIAVKGEGVTLRHLVVTAEDGKIAGPFTVDCATGALTAGEEATNSIKVSFGKGLQLKGDEATPIYVAVPAGAHGKFTLLLSSTTDIMKLSFDSAVKPVVAGKVREFAEFTYQANATEEDIFLIDSKDALMQFAEKAANFAPYTTAKVVAPIDMTGAEWAPIADFGAYTFDGGDFEIKGLSAPLFGATAASIRNVKLTDVAYEVTDLAHSGAIACELYGGSLVNCSVSGTININNTTLAEAADSYAGICHGGLVGYASAATVTNCTNDIDITINSLSDAALSCPATVGGVVGGVSNGCTFDYVINNGDVTYAGTTQKGNMYISGIAGKNDGTTDEKDFVSISNCTNTGAISTAKGSKSAGDILLAGITGRLETISADTVCEELHNTGAITHNGECAALRAAGIVSYVSHTSYLNCSNTAAISATTGSSVSSSAYLAGIASQEAYVKSVKNCTNSGAITIGDGLNLTGASVMVGLFYNIRNLTTDTYPTVSECTNSGPISIGASKGSGRLYVGGVFYSIYTGEVSNCKNLSTGTIDVKTGTWSNRYMIGGFTSYISATTALPKVSITDCANEAAITIEPTSDALINSAQIGGIVAEPYYNENSDNVVNLTRVNNSGDIVVKGKYDANKYFYLGGIMGIHNYDNIVMKDCDNSGDITFSGTAQGPCIGGVVGHDENNKTFSMDGCDNSGNVKYDGTATTYVYLGGIIGHKSVNKPTEVKNSINTGNITLGDQTAGAAGSYRYFVGGLIGRSAGNLTMSSCTNGYISEAGVIDATKGAVTVGKVPSANAIAGCVGYSGGAATITSCKNYAPVKKSGDSGFSGDSQHYRTHVAGVLGVSYSGNGKVISCENYGDIESHAKSLGRTDLAGVCGTIRAATDEVKLCKNGGKVLYNVTASGESGVGGIVGYANTSGTITQCENLASAEVLSTGTMGSNMGLGGIVGGTSAATAVISYCKNNGAVKQTAGKYNYFYAGGIVGYPYSLSTITCCENHGQLTIGSATGDTVNNNAYVGGVIGYYNGKSAAATITHCYNDAKIVCSGNVPATYGVGGVIGASGLAADKVTACNNLLNLGDIEFSGTAKTCKIGGVAGHVAAPISDCQSYCNIKAMGLEGKVGMVMGIARADATKAANCKVGGSLVFEQKTSGGVVDEEGYEIPVTVTDVVTTLDGSNWFQYIYNAAVEKAVAEGDGCSLLTEKPAVPVNTPAAN